MVGTIYRQHRGGGIRSVSQFGDVSVEVGADRVAEVQINRPPDNFFDVALLHDLADAYDVLDGDPSCRAIVLCAAGKNFCAGAKFDPKNDVPVPDGGAGLYDEAVRLFAAKTPVVAAIRGAAIGGGLGLACSA